jgi:hypothetical protein
MTVSGTGSGTGQTTVPVVTKASITKYYKKIIVFSDAATNGANHTSYKLGEAANSPAAVSYDDIKDTITGITGDNSSVSAS